MSDLCRRCGAKCCTYFCFEIDEPDDYREFEDVRWYLCHEGVSVHIDEGDWYISIANRCRNLTADGTCATYEDRPLICRKYDTSNCDFTGGDYGYDELFETPEQLEQYAIKTLGREAYEAARKAARDKIARKAARKLAIGARKTGKKGGDAPAGRVKKAGGKGAANSAGRVKKAGGKGAANSAGRVKKAGGKGAANSAGRVKKAGGKGAANLAGRVTT
jgi:Fe-S-cluster containining protein